jgi:hypothetical protein
MEHSTPYKSFSQLLKMEYFRKWICAFRKFYIQEFLNSKMSNLQKWIDDITKKYYNIYFKKASEFLILLYNSIVEPNNITQNYLIEIGLIQSDEISNKILYPFYNYIDLNLIINQDRIFNIITCQTYPKTSKNSPFLAVLRKLEKIDSKIV